MAFPAYEQGTTVDVRSVTFKPDDMERRKAMTELVKLKLRIAKAQHR